MKNLFLFCLVVGLFVSCKANKAIANFEVQIQSEKVDSQTISTLPNSFEKKDLEDVLPIKIQEFLENAEEFEILSWDVLEQKEAVEKFNVQGFGILGTKIVKVTDVEIKKRLLESLYGDINSAKNTSLMSQTACFIPIIQSKQNIKVNILLLPYVTNVKKF